MVSELTVIWIVCMLGTLMLGIAIGLWFRQLRDIEKQAPKETLNLESEKEVQ